MEAPTTHRSSTDPTKPDSLCDRFVTGNPDLDNWIWIIEYFAKFRTELWMIHDVFELGPKLPDYLGEHTNEMVAFRCLASLFDSSTSSGYSGSDANSKIEFDSSESCEYVLQCILDEIPLTELKPGAPGLSKWNLVPFIRSKLLSLPKCAMELMIEQSSEDDTEALSCNGQEPMRSDCKETNQVRSDGDEISRFHSLLEGKNNGHTSSPSEYNYKCIECKESGKLLYCSGEGCKVMVHEQCVDSPAAYDDAGNFYCTLCSFTCAPVEYLQSQDEVAKSKKKLISFLSLVSQVNKKKHV